jgi:hypothetical protein
MHMYKDLHVLHTPIVTLLSSSPPGVLLLKALFLESIPSVYIIRILAMMSSETQDEKPSTHQRRPTYIQA